MKKIFGLILTVCLSITVLACNLNPSSTATTSATTTSTTSTSLNSTTGTSNPSTTTATTTTTQTTSQTTTTSTTAETTTSTTTAPYQYQPIELSQVVYDELYNSFLFFYEAVNGDPASSGYGMITDRINPVTRQMGAASIASVGFGIAALPIGIENNWITYQEGYDRTIGTITTIEGMQRTHGFFYHFVNMSNARRAGSSEVSIIDTAILICGLIMAGEYFGGEIKTRVNAIYQAVEWNWYFNSTRQMFYMGYQPESGFGGAWDYYGEQLMIYLLAAASDNYAVGKTACTVMKNRTPRRSLWHQRNVLRILVWNVIHISILACVFRLSRIGRRTRSRLVRQFRASIDRRIRLRKILTSKLQDLRDDGLGEHILRRTRRLRRIWQSTGWRDH
ncbi:MAG: hypothetical protein MZU97_00505 [Bacillus subtilis]|nr:hypothetical protein [Bacillus subtilis]